MRLKRNMMILIVVLIAFSVQAADDAVFKRARESARIASFSLSKTQRWLYEKCLPEIDKETGLIEGNRKSNGIIVILRRTVIRS